mgnify:CR=1 FL=1
MLEQVVRGDADLRSCPSRRVTGCKLEDIQSERSALLQRSPPQPHGKDWFSFFSMERGLDWILERDGRDHVSYMEHRAQVRDEGAYG